ncbi:hypothetical protein SK128_007808, partial [Halocaridina rubra]
RSCTRMLNHFLYLIILTLTVLCRCLLCAFSCTFSKKHRQTTPKPLVAFLLSLEIIM